MSIYIAPWGALDENNTIVYKAIYDGLTIVYNPTERTIKAYDEELEPVLPLITLSDRWHNIAKAVFPWRHNKREDHEFLRVTVHEFVKVNNIHAQGPLFEIARTDKPQL